MISPFTNTDGAFDPFFTEQVSITTNDGNKTTLLHASIFTNGQADPLADDDGMMETEREDLTFVFNQKEWPFIQKLQRGATIRIMSTQSDYVVSSAKLDHFIGCCVNARQK